MSQGTRRNKTLEELGARTWVNHHPETALRLNITDVMFQADPTALREFCTITNVNEEQLKKWGRRARALGYARNTTYKKWDLPNGATVALYRSLKPGWDMLDGTMPHSDNDTLARYTQVVGQGKNLTCSIDVTIFCALRLDLGRLQIDQLPLPTISTLGVIPRFMRSLLSKYWGTSTLAERTLMRNLLMTLLLRHCPRMHREGEYHSALEVVEACFQESAQLGYTSIAARMCCDSVLSFSPATKASRHYICNIPAAALNNGKTFETAIQQVFQMRERPKGDAVAACSRGERCDGSTYSIQVVLDRMPPVLVVGTHKPVTKEEDKKCQAFSQITFHVQGPAATYPVVYQPLGCIMLREQKHCRHFTARWIANRPSEQDHRIAYYDGMSSDQTGYVNDWYDSSPFKRATRRGMQTYPEEGPVVLFYGLMQTEDDDSDDGTQ